MPSRTRSGPACPECTVGRGLPIVYGMPGPDLFEAAERREVALGGCVVGGDDPQWRCRECGHEWGGRR